VKSSGCTSDGLACITLDVIQAETTIECILDYISETGQDMDKNHKVSMLHWRCYICISACICPIFTMSFAICCPSGCTVASSVVGVVSVCNCYQM